MLVMNILKRRASAPLLFACLVAQSPPAHAGPADKPPIPQLLQDFFDRHLKQRAVQKN